tara:strand:+ start:274 stop:885 length:612 start_codon:yes stop_codon:yes gene_type:complete
MEAKSKKPIRIRLAEKLIKDQQELEHLAVQASLGKVEMEDEFKAAKAELKKSIHELKVELKHELKETEESVLKNLEKIDGQLDEDVAYTKESFLIQKKNIVNAINDAKKSIKNSPQTKRTTQLFNAISQKSKLQLELLEKNASDKKVELTEDYEKSMLAATEKFEEFTSKIKEEKEDASKKAANFKKEVAQSYKHIKKAFKSL